MEQLEKDIAAANVALQNTPFDLLRDPDGLNLRKYQINAIEAAEQAVIDGKQTVLLSMATGTGKTRTILGMIYRFIKSDRFKRVLFLVDRTALGEQAEDVFKEVKIEELMTLDSIYNIKGLDEKEIDKETKIHLMKGLEVATTDEQLAYQIDLIVAKLQRKRRNVSQKALEQFVHLTGGMDLGSFAEYLNSSTIKEATTELLGHREAFSVLDKDRPHSKISRIIDDHPDELIDHTRGYGEGQKPEDYLEAFKEFINNNMNAIAALRTVCTRPSELTREDLKSLKLELDRHDFTEKQLNSAWNEMTNQDIVADIIAFIRQQALGSTLISHEQRVKYAFAKLRVNHDFNKNQLDWLKRIEKVLLEESVLDEQIFEIGAFKNAGGFTIIDRRFGGKLREIITELNEYLYEDGGSIA